jgi:hypothetical protein
VRPLENVGERPGLAEQKSLRVGNAGVAYDSQVFFSLDAFRDDDGADVVREPAQRVDHRAAFGIARAAVDKIAVDLEQVGGDVDDRSIVAAADAHVIERDANAFQAELPDGGDQRMRAPVPRFLNDLQDDAARIDVLASQRRREELREPAVALERGRMHVQREHRHLIRARCRADGGLDAAAVGADLLLRLPEILEEHGRVLELRSCRTACERFHAERNERVGDIEDRLEDDRHVASGEPAFENVVNHFKCGPDPSKGNRNAMALATSK